MPRSANNRKANLLIVEDDELTQSKMKSYFETEGYCVTTAGNAHQMRKYLQTREVDLVLLDIDLPDDDGLSIARDLRSNSNIGIILVTGKDSDVDRIIGLEIGADDYVTKPFNARELLARVRGLLRRTEAQAAPAVDHKRSFAGWGLNPLRRTLTSPNGEEMEMTRAELDLITTFTNHPGQTLSRERLMNCITHRSWNPNDRTIDVLIRRVRQKMETDPKKPTLIKTIHGEGYMFCESVIDSTKSSNA
ncbi:MAG: response regulator [Gammaproteobacteria bacterium]|nr:response regulator [Gammaproteobacteria bacterium]